MHAFVFICSRGDPGLAGAGGTDEKVVDVMSGTGMSTGSEGKRKSLHYQVMHVYVYCVYT